MMETKRLLLRRFSQDDFPAFADLIRDKMRSELSAYDNQFPIDDEGLRGALDYVAGLDAFFAMILQGSNELVGFVSLHSIDGETRNLGYCVHSRHQENGYATEATAAAIAYAKDVLHVRKLSAFTAEVNTPSVRLLRHAGFTCIGQGRSSFVADKEGNPIVFSSLRFEKPL